MPEHLISRDEAESDLVAAAAYLAEAVSSADGRAEAMSAVVPLYLKRNDVDTAAELANSVDDGFTRDRLLTQVAEKCAETDDDEYALQLAEAIEDTGLRSQALERVALIKASKGQLEAASGITADLDHRDFALAGIAAKQAELGDKAAADATLASIEFPSAKVHGLLEIASSDVENKVELLAAAESAADEIEHNEERIRALLDIGNLLIEAERSDLAIRTFDHAKEESEALDNVHRDAFLAGVALGFFRAGSLDLADRALDLVSDKTQTAACLLGYAREFWKRGEHAEAIDALEEAYAILKSQRDREIRSSKSRYELFTSIAAQFAGFERGERAIGIAQEIESEPDHIAALTQIAGILALRKEDEEARHALQAIPDDASRVFALIAMSDSKEKNGDRDGAVVLLDEVLVLAEAVPQVSARSSALNEIGRRFETFGQTEKSAAAGVSNLALIATIRDESSRALALANLSEVYPAEVREADAASVRAILRDR